MSATASKPHIVERLREAGRLADALALVLGRAVNAEKTIAIQCLDPSHADRHASAVVEPANGRVTCKGCGRTWGLLEIGVLRGLAPDAAGVARRLEETFFGVAARAGGTARTGTETPRWHRNPPPPRLEKEVLVPVPPGEGTREGTSPGASARTSADTVDAFPFVPDEVVRSLGWVLAKRGRTKFIKAAIFDRDLTVCGVKVRGPRRADGQHQAYLETCRAGRREKGLLCAEGLRDRGRLVLVLAGETDLLAFREAALREEMDVLAVSPSNGETQDFHDLAEAFREQKVVVIYDMDKAGRTGALDRCWELRGTAQQAVALALPFTAEQIAAGMKDVRDYISAGGTAKGLVDLAVKALAGEGTVSEEPKKDTVPKVPAVPAIPWTPFPVAALPPALAELVTEGAAAIGCDPSFVALTALSVIAGAIGNTRTILLKRGWTEPCVVWTALVGESGTHKSPSMDLAMEPLRAEDDEAQAEHAEDVRIWRREKQRYEASFNEWKRSGGSGEPPVEPEYPKARRFVVVDATVEAIAKLLSENPRGLLLARDELSGWLRSFDAYRSGKGGDAAFYLLAHGARQHTVDRKGTDTPTIHVPRAALSIAGGIQPAVLAATIGKEHADDGLLARLLLAMPPRTVGRWTTAVVDELTKAAYAQVVRDLLAIPLVTDEHGMPKPVALPLSKEGQNAWVSFFDGFAERQAAAVGNEAAALAKLVSYAARFALVHQLVRDPTATEIDEEAVRSGARLFDWFADEIVRVYGVLVESPQDTQRRRLTDWISARGGRTTVRDLSHGPREYRDKEVAEQALDALVAAGIGSWEEKQTGEKGGRPTRSFVLKKSTDEGPADDASEEPSPATPPAGTGTKTPDSSLGGGGFRCQEGVSVPPAGVGEPDGKIAAEPSVDVAADPSAPTSAAPETVERIDLADLPGFEDDDASTSSDAAMLAAFGVRP